MGYNESNQVFDLARCPWCGRRQNSISYLDGIDPKPPYQLSKAVVICCEHCGKDFFNEEASASCNYKCTTEDSDEQDVEEIENLKAKYGYITKEIKAQREREWQEKYGSGII